MTKALLILSVAAALAVLAGCGGGGSSSGGSSTGTGSSTGPGSSTGSGSSSGDSPSAAAEPSPAAKKSARIAEEGEALAPKGASPTLKGIYRAFQKPSTEGLEPKSVNAVAAGEAACGGKTPAEVKAEFFAEAKEYLEPEQLGAIAEIGKFEAQAKTDQSFVAGQLAADVYSATLEEDEEQAGFQGCVYSLARGLEKRLAPKVEKK